MEFTKMEAAGNDFVVFDGFKYKIKDYSELALKACDRHFSVGADGILVCEDSDIADIKMIYYNSDGSRGEMCGNGIRCFSKYVYEKGLIDKKVFTVDTLAGIKTIWLETDNENRVKTVKVNMGKPLFGTKNIPVNLDKGRVIEETMDINGQKIVFSSLLVGVPHTVIFVDNIKNIDINELGRKIEVHPIFPRKTNVNFIEVVDRDNINIYTWERGAGRTLGCGTGSCASVVIGYMIGKLNNTVHVKTEGGELEVQLEEDFEIYMKGGANIICDGVFYQLI